MKQLLLSLRIHGALLYYATMPETLMCMGSQNKQNAHLPDPNDKY